MQDSKEILARQPDSKDKLKEAKEKIDTGIVELNEFVNKMDRAIEMIKEKDPENKLVDDLYDSKKKCEEMLHILTKKENADFSEKTAKTKRNKYGLSREEQLILDNWEQQMKEIVGSLGRGARESVRGTEGSVLRPEGHVQGRLIRN